MFKGVPLPSRAGQIGQQGAPKKAGSDTIGSHGLESDCCCEDEDEEGPPGLDDTSDEEEREEDGSSDDLEEYSGSYTEEHDEEETTGTDDGPPDLESEDKRSEGEQQQGVPSGPAGGAPRGGAVGIPPLPQRKPKQAATGSGYSDDYDNMPPLADSADESEAASDFGSDDMPGKCHAWLYLVVAGSACHLNLSLR